MNIQTWFKHAKMRFGKPSSCGAGSGKAQEQKGFCGYIAVKRRLGKIWAHC